MTSGEQLRLIVLVLAFGLAASASGEEERGKGSGFGLQIGPKICGSKACEKYQYCSDSVCEPCKGICEKDDNNFTPDVCEKKCQDYIHDHINHYLNNEKTKNLSETIEWLRVQVAVSITISCIVALVVLALAGFLWLTHRRKSSRQRIEKDRLDKKMQSVAVIVNNNESDSNKEKSLRLEMPVMDGGGGVLPVANRHPTPPTGSATAAPSVATATTPLSTRHPSEDATLEFAYDNPALNPSPELNQPRHETTF